MRGGGETEESDGGPCVGREQGVHVGHEDDRGDAEGTDQHGDLAAGVYAVTVLHEEAGEPSAADGADARGCVDRDDERVGVAEVEAVVAVEELREVEEVEPPDAIGEAFADEEGPGAAMFGEKME